MPRGLKKLTHAASTPAAWQDWRAIQSWCDQNGRGERAGRHTAPEGAGWKTLDQAITALRADLGAPSGPWGDNVLEGLTPEQREQQQPQPPAEPQQCEQRQGTDAGRAYEEAYYRLCEEAGRRLGATVMNSEGLSWCDLADRYPDQWDAILKQLKQEHPLPPHPVRVYEESQTWVLGSQLQPDEQRYVLELFPESRAERGLSAREWLEQTSFRLKRDGTLDLRHRYCRINPRVDRSQEPYRYHRSPRYTPLPEPPQRQEQREQQQGDANSEPEQTYSQRVLAAYEALSAEMQSLDVPIHAIHRRVGGSLLELQNHLRAECLGHRAAATTGEPTVVGDAARQSALRLPGESETFLNIKLLNPPAVSQQRQPHQPKLVTVTLRREDFELVIGTLTERCQEIAQGDFDQYGEAQAIGAVAERLEAQQQQPPRITLTLNVNQADLVAETLHYGAYELEQYADGHGRDIDGVETHCDYLGDLEKGLMAFVRNPRERASELRQDQPAELPAQVKYEKLLRETAALRYPQSERTAELEARIEKTIARKVGEFTQERQLKEYEQSLRRTVVERHPDLSEEQRLRYNQRILDLVAERREEMARQQQ